MKTLKIFNTNNTAFVIGNGKSREGFDLNSLRPYGTIFGCNALYREFEPDYLVAIDPPIIDEIKQSSFPQDRFIVPKEEEQFENPEYNPFTRWRSNAGMNAIIEAIRKNNTNIYLLGFDFILANDLAVQNIYDGTDCYGPETRSNMTDNFNRAKYLNWFVNKFAPNVKYTMILPRLENLKIQPINGNNVEGVFIDNLMTHLKNTVKQAA